MTGESSAKLRLLHRSLSAQSCSVVHLIRLVSFMIYGMRLSFADLMCFLLRKSVFIENKVSCFLCFMRLFYDFILCFS